MALTTTGGASILTPEEVGALVVRPLMEQSVAAQVSTVVQTSSHDFRVPVVSAPTPPPRGPLKAPKSLSDPTITEVVVTPKKLAGLTVITNELAADSSPAALQVVGDGLVRDLKRKLDAAYFGNTTTNGPNGLRFTHHRPVDAGDAWTNLDAFEGARVGSRNPVHQLGAFVANPATALARVAERGNRTRTRRCSALTRPHRHSRVIARCPALRRHPPLPTDVVWGIPTPHSISYTDRTPPSSPTPACSLRATGSQCGRHCARLRLHLPGRVVKINITP